MPPIDIVLTATGALCGLVGVVLSLSWRPYRYRAKPLANGRYVAQYRYRFLPVWFDVRRGVTDKSAVAAVDRCRSHRHQHA